MIEKPIISVSDFKDTKIVTFRYLSGSESDTEKLSLIVECDDHNICKIYINSEKSYTVFSLDDNGNSVPEFSNIME